MVEEEVHLRFIDEDLWKQGLILPDKGKVLNEVMRMLITIRDAYNTNLPIESLSKTFMNRLYLKAINVKQWRDGE